MELQRLLREMGLRSEIYAERSAGTLAGRARQYQSYARLPRRRPTDLLLYQSAISSSIGADWLVVSRVAPHKAQQDVIRSLAAYRQMYDPLARLRIVGGSSSDRYVTALRSMAADLGVADAVEITGAVRDGVLAAHYRAAD